MIIPGTLESGPATRWPLMSALPPVAALTTAPGIARAYVRGVLADWRLGGVSEVAELVASEMVANSVAASTAPAGGLVYVGGRTPVIRVCVMSDRAQVLIECHDEAPGQPQLRDVDPWTAETGRGLAIVDALTARNWGWQPAPGGGKVVWAALATPGGTPESASGRPR